MNKEQEKNKISRNTALAEAPLLAGIPITVGGLISGNKKLSLAGFGGMVAGGVGTNMYCKKNEKKLKEIYGKGFSCNGSKSPVTDKHQIAKALGIGGLSAAGFLASKNNPTIKASSIAGGALSGVMLGSALLSPKDETKSNNKKLNKTIKKQVKKDKEYKDKHKILNAIDALSTIPVTL